MQSYSKEDADKGLKEADKKVDQGVNAIEQSKVGQVLPTHIEKIEFRDIVFGLLFLIGILTIPTYLFISTYIEAKAPTRSWVGLMCYYSLLFTGVLGIAFDMVVIMMKKQPLLKVSMLLKVIKAITLVVMMFLLRKGGLIANCLRIAYFLGVMAVDALFVYYSAIYFRRLASSDYDDQGRPVKK